MYAYPMSYCLTIHTFGVDEAQVRQQLGPLLADGSQHPMVALAAPQRGIISVCITSTHSDAARAKALVNHAAEQVEQRLGSAAFGRGSQTLQEAVIALLCQQRLTLVTAESCTGGLIGKRLTDVPGASQAYLGGWVVYANAMKIHQLGVCASLIKTHGAVSQAVVRAMASGAVRCSVADRSVAITGIAGPQGGCLDKPVGTVWIGLGFNGPNPDSPIRTEAFWCQLPGDRAAVRDLAAKCALQLLRLALLGAPLEGVCFAQRVAGGQ